MVEYYILEPIGNVIGRSIFNRKSVFGPIKERLKGEEESLSKPLTFEAAYRKSMRLYKKYGLRTRVISLNDKIARERLRSKQKRQGLNIRFKNPLDELTRGMI